MIAKTDVTRVIQCGDLRIFPLVIFYVKSKTVILEGLKLPFWPF